MQSDSATQPAPDAAELTPGQENTLYAQAYYLSQQGKHEEASGLLSLLALYRPDSELYAAAVGICYRKMERYDAACLSFARVLELNPNDVGAMFQVIECLALLGRRDEAVRYLEVLEAAARKEGDAGTLNRAASMLAFHRASLQ